MGFWATSKQLSYSCTPAPGGDEQALVIAESANVSTLDCSGKVFLKKDDLLQGFVVFYGLHEVYRTGRTALPQPAPGFSVATAVMMIYDSTAVLISSYLVKFLL